MTTTERTQQHGATSSVASGGRSYRLISADSHVNEPGDLFTARVPERLKPHVPRIESFPQGDAWVIEGVKDPINFGWNACAGMDPSEMTGWKRFDEIRRGGWDAQARLLEMDKDGVDAEVMYPTPRLHAAVASSADPELHLAMVRAYNDWISEYVEVAPARFGGVALLPNCGVNAAVAEIDRVWGRPGVRTFVLGRYGNGTLEIEADDDKVWAAFAERGIAVNIHVGLATGLPSAHRSPLPGFGRFFDAPHRIVQFIFAGVFDRFPDLEVVFAEVDCGWVPYFKEQVDDNFRRLQPTSDYIVSDAPSSYINRHIYFTFMNDAFGIRSRGDVGVERIMWSSDYPHVSANWPTSWRTIHSTFSGVPEGERNLILAGNAARVYGFA